MRGIGGLGHREREDWIARADRWIAAFCEGLPESVFVEGRRAKKRRQGATASAEAAQSRVKAKGKGGSAVGSKRGAGSGGNAGTGNAFALLGLDEGFGSD